MISLLIFIISFGKRPDYFNKIKNIFYAYTLVLVCRIKLISNLLVLGFEFLYRKSYNGIVDFI